MSQPCVVQTFAGAAASGVHCYLIVSGNLYGIAVLNTSALLDLVLITTCFLQGMAPILRQI